MTLALIVCRERETWCGRAAFAKKSSSGILDVYSDMDLQTKGVHDPVHFGSCVVQGTRDGSETLCLSHVDTRLTRLGLPWPQKTAIDSISASGGGGARSNACSLQPPTTRGKLHGTFDRPLLHTVTKAEEFLSHGRQVHSRLTHCPFSLL